MCEARPIRDTFRAPLLHILCAIQTEQVIFYTSMTLETRFFTLSVDSLYILGIDGYFKRVNPAFEKLLGRSAEELLAEPFIEFIHPDDRAATLQEIENATTGTPISSLENRFQGKDGSYLWLEWTVHPVLSEGVMYGIGRDITQRKQTEQVLKESEERFRLMADSAPVLIWISRTDKLCYWFNKPWLNFTGRTLEQEFGNGWTEGVHPDDFNRCLNTYVTSFEVRQPFTMEYRLKRHDGEYRWMVDKGTPLYGIGGEFTGYIGSCTDITELKEVEEELRINRDRLDLAIKASELGTFYCDLPLDRIIWNNKCKEHFWLPPEAEVNFALFYSIIHPDDREQTQQAIDACVFERKGYDIEYRTVALDGRTRWVRAIGNCFYDESNNPIRFDGITIDVTDRKKAESEQEALLKSERKARSLAERASRLKDEFLLTLSHELRTPLNAILGWSQLLRKGKMDVAKMARGLDIIERNVRAQAHLIDDLLDMSRIISGKLRLNVQRVNIGAVIESALETVRLSAEVKDIRLQKVLDPQAGIVSGDPERLQQIVWNLLSNAIKFNPKGGRVQVVLERVNSHIEISVIDTGQGIKPEFLPYVFDRFRQADASTTRNEGGLGLGLAIVKQLTELHGGSVRVKSAGEGKGAAFIIALPLVVVHPEAVEPEDFDKDGTMSASGDYQEPTLDGVKVLVVDDEPDARELIQRVLEGCNAEVITASSVQEALEALSRFKPHVLISDIGMPQEDGYQLIRKVRERQPDQGGMIPAVALTAYARAEDRKRVLLSGYQMHIAKPIEADELVAVVTSLTSLMPKRQEGEPSQGKN